MNNTTEPQTTQGQTWATRANSLFNTVARPSDTLFSFGTVTNPSSTPRSRPLLRRRVAIYDTGDAYFHHSPQYFPIHSQPSFRNHTALARRCLRSSAGRYRAALQNPLNVVPSRHQPLSLANTIRRACSLFSDALAQATTNAEADAALAQLSVQITATVSLALSEVSYCLTNGEVDIVLETATEGDISFQNQIRSVRNGVLLGPAFTEWEEGLIMRAPQNNR